MNLYMVKCKVCGKQFKEVATGEEISAGIATAECPKCEHKNSITNDTTFLGELKEERPAVVSPAVEVTADVTVTKEVIKYAREQYGNMSVQEIAENLLYLKISQGMPQTVSWDAVTYGKTLVENVEVK